VTSTTAGFSALSDHRRGQLAVGLAALCWSTAGFLQRELDVDLATQLAGRALFAGLALLAFTAATYRGATLRVFISMGRAGLAVGDEGDGESGDHGGRYEQVLLHFTLLLAVEV